MDPHTTISRKPEWLRISLNSSRRANRSFFALKRMMKDNRLNTVCEEAKCPNIHECWGEHKTATFMILGDICTRRCRFCSVKTGLPRGIDLSEPRRVAKSVAEMQLSHVVITMVDRDDLPDGGATMLAKTVDAIHAANSGCTVEVLSSDLMGKEENIETVCNSNPEVTSHNIETTRRLTALVRSRSNYVRSLNFLRTAKRLSSQTVIKSSIMVGLGENVDEIEETMDDLLDHGVTVLNIGQYLQPTPTHLPVQKYWHPSEFDQLRETAIKKGFAYCEAAPLVRSSYHAGGHYDRYRRRAHPLSM